MPVPAISEGVTKSPKAVTGLEMAVIQARPPAWKHEAGEDQRPGADPVAEEARASGHVYRHQGPGRVLIPASRPEALRDLEELAEQEDVPEGSGRTSRTKVRCWWR